MDGVKDSIGVLHGIAPMLFKRRYVILEYLAHLDREKGESQLLNTHLQSVAIISKNSIPPTVEFEEIWNSVIKEVSYYLGYLHDLGKYSDYFQEYLKENKDSPLKNHAHISACFIHSVLSDKLKLDEQIKKIFIFLAYICIRQHHTSLSLKGLFSFRYDSWDRLELLENHLGSKAKIIVEELKFKEKLTSAEFLQYLRIKPLAEDTNGFQRMPIRFENGRINHHKWFFILVYLFSVLIDADKLDSAYLVPKGVTPVSPDNVTKYLASKPNKQAEKPENIELNQRREKARKTMLGAIDNLSEDEVKNLRLFTLTAPTGIGKTLSSFQCALRLQERIAQIEKYVPRIITAIPFINIIEQNKREYENVLNGEAKIIVHHRLSDFSLEKTKTENPMQGKEYDAKPVDKVLMETEAWEGDVILTTFVQLFHSIFTGQNRPLKKFNKIAGSILILDEAQAIPEDYMPLIGATLQVLSKYYGTRIILMTATQPKLLEFGDKFLSQMQIKKESCNPRSLLPDYEEYFKSLARTKLVPLLKEKMDEKQFMDLFFQKWAPKKSALIVVNTIKRSIDIYNRIKKEIHERNHDVLVYYLSTNIVPLDRRAVIEEVNDLLKEKKKVILVSTQTIEAGVDLDFDMAFRDFAPLDSLIQTAGRVNREGRKGNYLPVYIIRLENDNHYVYNLMHRQSTIGLLSEKEEILENEYGRLAEQYYNMALARDISDQSKKIWEQGIIKLDFEALQEFELIKNISEVCDVFVEKDANATNLADVYQELLTYKDEINYDLTKIFAPNIANQFEKKLNIYQRKALLKLISAKMSDYIVQIRWNRVRGNLPVDFSVRGGAKTNLFWVPPGQLTQYYADGETGFIDEGGSLFIDS